MKIVDMAKGKSEKKHLIRFVVTGGCSTIIDYMLYHFLVSKGVIVLASKALSTGLMIFVVFWVNREWTFRSLNVGKKGEFMRYVMTQAINFITNISINAVLVFVTENINFSFATATLISSCVNFLLQRFFVFGRK